MSAILGGIFAGVLIYVGILAILVVLAFIGAIPVYFLWGYLGPKYFTFLPEVWVNIGYYDIAWMMMFFSIIGSVIFKSHSYTSSKE